VTLPRLAVPSLVHLLNSRGDLPDGAGYVFLAEDGQSETARLSYRDLDRRARAAGARLAQTVEPGERAVLLFPPGLDFIAAFFACLYSGVVAVPTYPPNLKRDLSRLRAILRDAAPQVVLAPAETVARAEGLLPDFPALRWLALPESGEEAGDWRAPAVGPETLAFLQYTSGSTGDPKGVVVTHGNLLANEALIQQTFAQTESSVVVSWLPLYHDMGLIGGVLQPLYAGSRCILMSPVAFLQRPRRWLEAISRHRATTSGGPDFAYDLCVRKIPPEQRGGLDLSSWDVAFNGAEPVRAATLERFASAFAGCGFRRAAFRPCYGLAEATLLVAGAAAGTGPSVLTVDAAALAAHRAAPAGAGSPGGVDLAGSGVPGSGVTLAVVDPETLVPCAGGEVGEIWVRGPSVAQGYWRRAEETERTFAARFAGTGEGPFLRTGDLGFLWKGEVYVTGRRKDLIILRGRNLYPQDIEETAGRSAPALRPGCCAAFAVDHGGEERLVVVQEMDRSASRDLRQVADAVRGAVAEEHAAEVFAVVLVRTGGVPRTTSGKVQRQACRTAWLGGELPVLFESRGEGEGRGAAAAAQDALRTIRTASPEERPCAARAYVNAVLASVLRVDPSLLEPGQPVSALGLDSVAAIELSHRLAGDLGVDVPLRALLEGATPDWLASEILRHPGRPAEPTAVAPDPEQDAPLSYGQQALWYMHRLAPESGAYNLAVALRIRGPLDAERLRTALQGLPRLHTVLRTVFPATGEDGEPAQRVLPGPLPVLELRQAPGLEEAALEGLLRGEADRPFDLERGPLVRAHLWWTGEAEHVLLLSAHHIVADFWSLSLLARQLGELYAGREVRAAGPRFADYVRQQHRLVDSEAGELLGDFWRRHLAGEPAPLDLPADRPRPPVQSHQGGIRRLLLPGLASCLRSLGRPTGATLSMAVLAAWQAQLHRLSGQTDFVVGVPTLGRSRAELAEVVGYFVNPLPLRADLAESPAFATVLERVRRSTLEALEHADFPLLRIAERVRVDRDASRSHLFQVLFTFQSAPPGSEHLAALALGQGGAAFHLAGLRCESVALDTGWAQMDLELMAAEIEGSLAVALRYDGDLFDAATAERLLDQLARLAAAAADDPKTGIADLPLLGEAERAQLLVEWNGSEPPGEPACIHSLIEEQARRTPDAVALTAGERQLTYWELDDGAERLAAHLRSLGVEPESAVGVCSGRSPEMVQGILATLKAGGTYVPLDPGYPDERLGWILEETGARVLLADRSTPRALLRAGVRIVDLESEAPVAPVVPARQAEPENLACILYTSGSTGRPKGVGVRHAAVTALLRWALAAYSPADLAATVFSTSISFDLSLFEMFAPLAAGGRIVLVPNTLVLSAASPVTLLNTVPSAATELLERDALPRTLRVVNLAGEPLPRTLVDRLHATLPGARVYNLYGPSEDTTYSTGCLQAPGAADRPPIGKPLAGSRAYVLDPGGRLAPPGVSGELHLGGAGVARGYLLRPGLTAERFVPDPWSGVPGARLYRTGDLARWRPDGELELIGRLDHQVKIRGFRIELGEVEAALRRHPGLRDAVVLAAGEESDRRLVAYLVAAQEPAPGARELRGFLAARLPDFMVPVAFAVLPALPLTPNGKVDRRALPALASGGAAALFVAPRTPTEEVIAALWADLLGCERVGVQDSFFELGGHSLLAARAVARLREPFGVELPLTALLERPTVAELAAAVERARREGAAADEPPRSGLPRPPETPLSFSQERLWLLEQLGRTGPAYTLALGHRLRGALDETALERALVEIVRRHEPLRATFAGRGGQPVQDISDGSFSPLARADLSGLGEDRREPEALRLAREASSRPFDLERGPLLRVILLALGPEDRVLVLAVHHIVSDGWSVGIFLSELAALYSALRLGRSSPLPQLTSGYVDYVLWQRRRLTGERLESLAAAWGERLSGLPAGLELPADRPYPPVQTFRGAILPVTLEADLVRRLRWLAHGRGATLFMALLAAFQALLNRHTGQTVFAVGIPAAGRSREEWEPLIGFFVNMLPLRADLGGDPGFGELLTRVRRTALDGFAGEDLPFERIVEAAGHRRDLARNPMFQVVLTLESAPAGALCLDGVAAEPIALHTGTAKLELSLSLAEAGGAVTGSLEYNSDLFDVATAERLARHLENLLRGAVDLPAARLSELPLLSGVELRQILEEWNDTATTGPACDFVARVEAVAERHPDAPALESATASWTYAELDRRACGLARHLRRLGVGPESIVGLCAEGSPELVFGLLGVLKAGGAFLPLDPTYPAERLGFMLEDAGVPLVLAQEKALAVLPAGARRVLLLDDLLDDALRPAEEGEPRLLAPDSASLAYVIYTSGSTGRPKGVQVPRRGLANLAAAQERIFALGPGGRVLQFSSPSFDAFVWEVAMALGSGATLCLAPRSDLLPGADLARTLTGRRITHITLPPSALAVMPGGPAPTLAAVIVAGEACPLELAARWSAGRGVFDAYGPTENTVCATVESFAGDRLTIGRPLANMQAHVLDRSFHPVPVGAPGELCLGGAGLSRGYRARPGLTAAAFVPDPFGEPGSRLYRTGDLARRLPDGRLEFLGRIDDQVKVRGFRVEPGEVEAALAAHPAVAGCAVVAWSDGAGGARLVAYVVPAETAAADPEALAQFLRERLPSWLVPAVFVSLDELPRTASGKVDRRALPEPAAGRSGIAPRTPAEELIAGIWEDLLGRGEIGVHDDFFAAGGHSLLAVRVVVRLREAFGMEVPLPLLFANPTVASLALAMEEACRGGARRELSLGGASRSGELPLSFGQERLWFLQELSPGTAAYNLFTATRLEGPLDVPALGLALLRLTARHESLRTVFPRGATARPVQRITSWRGPGLPLVDLTALPAGRREEEAGRSLREEGARPFGLESGPLFRALLLRRSEGGHDLLLGLHHIVADGWSMDVMARELAALYAGGVGSLPALQLQPADFALSQRAALTGDTLAPQIAYWRGALAGAPASLDLPTDRPRPVVQTDRGRAVPVSFSARLARDLRASSRREGATLFMALLAGLAAVLHRYTGQEDLVIGTPAAHRSHRELEGLIGLFLTTLPLRCDLAGDPAWRDLLARVRGTALGAYAHQEVPFEWLVDELHLPRDLSRSPLFQVMLVLQDGIGTGLELPGLRCTPLLLHNGTAKLDLTLSLTALDGLLVGGIELNADLFDAPTAQRLAGHLGRLLEAALAEPGSRLAELPLLSNAEQAQLAVEWNDTRVEIRGGPCSIHDQLAAQVARVPGAVAVIHGEETLTYRELGARAGRLARRLARLGVLPGDRVGICEERSPAMLVAVLGILQAGAAYVPLDPSHPPARLAAMLADAQTAALVTSLPAGRRPEHSLTLVPEASDGAEDGAGTGSVLPALPTEAPAYVIYTSGSTGTPKGVVVSHRNVAYFFLAMDARLRADAPGVWLAVTSLSFDISVLELLWTLTRGFRVVLHAPSPAQGSAAVAEQIARHGVSHLQCTPSMAGMLAASPESLRGLAPLSHCLLGGEALPPALAERLAGVSGGTIHNLYGPTETTVWSLAQRIERGARISIGRPLANTEAYLLDRRLRPVPLGSSGEICLAGEGVAAGYWRRPDLTAERFVPDPFGTRPGGRLYRTGDLARQRPAGTLDFLGRLDHQVKVRGVRVELGEIEAALQSHPAVAETVVVVREETSGDRRLVAYVVAAERTAEGTLAAGDLRRYLAERLPEAMVPAAFVTLSALPLTHNGKVDRRSLPAPGGDRPALENAFVAPRTPGERAVAAVWRTALGRERIGIHDNFFDLGGNSLLLVEVETRLREVLDSDVPIVQMFRNPTIHGLARALAMQAREPSGEGEPPRRQTLETQADGGLINRQKQFLEERKQRRAEQRRSGR
jgi:amino acid adenylation domain-containing protein